MHLDSYLKYLSKSADSLASAVRRTAEELYAKINSKFDYRSHLTGLLMGNVQSGKTGQMLGLISKLADEGLEFFILLTSDNVRLQEQTFKRTYAALMTMDICGENDEIRFNASQMRRPMLLVLKKNTSILGKWRNTIAASKYLEGRPLVILDDEGDAASLNNLVNKGEVTKINGHISSIKNLATSSVYISVTATPQAVLLQSNISGWKPSFVHYFEPGEGYIGGDFIYSDPTSFCINFTDENELSDVLTNSDVVPEGLKRALITFLVICSEFSLQEKGCCNFLVHPSGKIDAHEKFAEILGQHLNDFLRDLSEEKTKEEFKKQIKAEWDNLQKTQPDLNSYDDIITNLEKLLTVGKFNILVLNSENEAESFETGYNIVVGGNSLGRGVTFPNLQVVYYCRRARKPQADTSWQHARVFGYDRIKGLLRIFTPPSLHTLFTGLNRANQVLIKQILDSGLEGIQIIHVAGVRPTRKSVLDEDALNEVRGGVNFFDLDSPQSSPDAVDKLTASYDDNGFHEVEADTIITILKELGGSDGWDEEKYINCVKALQQQRPTQKYALIVRRDRNIARDTGTLLSQDDRRLGEQLDTHVVLTVYRLNGSTDKKWKGSPFWIPNIKLPGRLIYYDTVEI